MPLLIFGCSSPPANDTESNTSSDKDTFIRDTIPAKTIKINNDTLLLKTTKQILTLIKKEEYNQFASFFHPVMGVRFSPYGYIDTNYHVKFTTDNFLKKLEQPAKIRWGNFDGTGDKMLLTIEEYFKKFVYNADFLNAEKTSLNKMLGHGNSLNNLEAIYNGCEYTESYFSGFDKKYDGMDWCCLRLVYKKYKGKIYLVGIVHDQWTI